MYLRVVTGRPKAPTETVMLGSHTMYWEGASLSGPRTRATATDVKKVATRLKNNSRPYQNELRAMVWVLSAEPEGPVFSVFIGCSRDKLHQNKVLPIWVATDGSRQTKSVAGCRANCQASCPRFTIQEGRALTFPGR